MSIYETPYYGEPHPHDDKPGQETPGGFGDPDDYVFTPEQLEAAAREDQDMRVAMAFDGGMDAAREGVHPVFSPEGDGPLFYIRWFHDSGDPSVGIPSQSFWAVVPARKPE